METDIKSKISADLGLIKRGVESRVAELDELGRNCEHNHSVVAERKEGIKDLPHKLLVGWKEYLQGRGQLLFDFSTWDLRQQTKRAKTFTFFFFLRPGIIKLHVVNFLLMIMAWVVRILVWTLVLALALGVIILVFYGLDALIGWITELIDNLRSKDPSEMPKGVE